jgi:hypothetical protein
MSTDILVCGPDSHFADDVHTTCESCGAPIVHRPHSPANAVKLCMECAAARLAMDEGLPKVTVTEETRREIELFYQKTDGTQ